MARVPYTYYPPDEDGYDGAFLGNEIEVEVEATADLYLGEPIVEITAVWIDRSIRSFSGGQVKFEKAGERDILNCRDGLWSVLAARIATAAEDDERVRERAMEDREIIWHGRGPGDPFGQWRAHA